MSEDKPAAAAADDSDDEELEFLEHDPSVSAAAPGADASGAAAAGPPAPSVPIVGTSMPIDQAVELLSKVNIFSGLQPNHLRRIAALGLEELHPANALVFSEGTQGDKVYLILSGSIRISRNVPGMGEPAAPIDARSTAVVVYQLLKVTEYWQAPVHTRVTSACTISPSTSAGSCMPSGVHAAPSLEHSSPTSAMGA